MIYSLHDYDFEDFLINIPSKSVDLIASDPPYESLEKHRAIGTTTRLKKSWFPIIENKRLDVLVREAYRVLKPNTHFYLFCDQETMFYVKPVAEAAGFKFWKPLVWDKTKIGMGYHYRAQYEFILFFEKGKRKLNDFSVPDVLSVPSVRGGFPTEKPVELNEILVLMSSHEGETVCDPFMGSGSSAIATLKNGRCFLGNDIQSKALVEERIRKECETQF